tara:strand:+ start:14751 stop:15092 length:342 start_codon:yes stop_codon:yes gene_type:complete
LALIFGLAFAGHLIIETYSIYNPMQLLNLSFAILIIKMAICILPGVIGIFMIVSSEEKKRELRNTICNQVFGVSNAIPYPKFAMTMVVIGSVLLVFTLSASWFLLLRDMFIES